MTYVQMEFGFCTGENPKGHRNMQRAGLDTPQKKSGGFPRRPDASGQRP